MSALAFDAYGTLFDVFSVTTLCEQLFPGKGNTLAQLWRTKQLQYSLLRSLMGQYKDFWQLTEDGLLYASQSLDLNLTSEKRKRLLDAYLGEYLLDTPRFLCHTLVMETPQTLAEAIKYFGDPDNSLRYLAAKRWPNGVECPYCAAKEPMFLKSRRIWKCRATDCRKQFSVKIGTVLNESPIPVEKWLTAMWLVANCRNGVSSCEIARDLGLTQKTAWFMLHRIREAMQDKTATKLAGEVEVDESFIGGKSRNMHAKRRAEVITGTGGKDKAIALGMVERGGNVRTFAVPNRRKHELHSKIRQHIKAGSALFSDALQSYNGLDGEYQHAVVDHAVEYVRGNVHTNTMENFWSLVKRQLHGTYISVEPFHLFRYLDEQSFRYNGRKLTDAERFAIVCGQVAGRRLTWGRLTGKGK